VTEPNTPAAPAAVMAYHHADDLPKARAFAQRHAEELGLAPDQVISLIIAVSELVTNTLQHTSSGGRLRIWAENGQVICDIIDQGPLRPLGRQMPPPDADRGRGLAIVERLCSEVNTFAGEQGTVVRLRFTKERPVPPT
jgi:serine/threonine-protein kinase RsbW